MKKWIQTALASIVMLVLSAPLLFGSGTTRASEPKTFVLFNGSNAPAQDSTSRRSYWIPIRGASQVVLRFFSQGATTDTSFCDSISAFSIQVGDSVSFLGVDSLGTIVTASNRVGVQGYNRFPVLADSAVITGNAADTTRGVAVYHPPVLNTVALRWSTNKGFYTWVYPVKPALTAWAAGMTPLQQSNTQAQFVPGYLSVRYTPVVRATTAGFNSTQGIRTQGLNRFYMVAYVYYPD